VKGKIIGHFQERLKNSFWQHLGAKEVAYGIWTFPSHFINEFTPKIGDSI
jgi:hypothetical protein